MDTTEVLWVFTRPGSYTEILSNYPVLGVITIIGAVASLIGAFRVISQGLGSFFLRIVLGLSLAVSVVLGAVLIGKSRTAHLTRKDAYELSAREFGITKDSLRHVVEIDARGGARITVSYAVRALGQPAEYIEEFYRIIAGVRSNNLARQMEIPLRRVRCTDGRWLTLLSEERSGSTIRATYQIKPALPAGRSTRLLDPLVQLHGPGTFSLTERELKEAALPYEWYGVRITYPCDVFECEVVFPKGVSPRAGSARPAAWYGEARVENGVELGRLERAGEGVFKTFVQPRDERTHMRLVVRYPLHAMRYAITWQPDE